MFNPDAWPHDPPLRPSSPPTKQPLHMFLDTVDAHFFMFLESDRPTNPDQQFRNET